MSNQRYHLTQFYELLAQLESRLVGARRLAECDGRMGWPRRGVYFFRETGECRADTGDGPRVVRVGTHALTSGAKATLWERLRKHKGTVDPAGGNHRESVFRKIVGAALIGKHDYSYPHWGYGNSARNAAARAAASPTEITENERTLERAVSAVIGDMPFLWLTVDDEPGPDSLRGYIERNAIALLSNYGRMPVDLPSQGWLGHHSDQEKVRQSGLWNSDHVNAAYDPAFLDYLERLIQRM